MIELKKAHAANKAGDVIELDASTESMLIEQGIAVHVPASAANAAKVAKASAHPAQEMPAPKPLTVPESIAALRAHIVSLQASVARGSKSDLDQIGARLGELVAWIDATLDDKRWNPGSVRTITVDPVAEHAAEKIAADKAAAAEKLAAKTA